MPTRKNRQNRKQWKGMTPLEISLRRHLYAHTNSVEWCSRLLRQEVPSYTDSDEREVFERLHPNNLAKQDEDNTNKDARNKFNRFVLARTKKVAPLVWKGKEGREVGLCYANAYTEFMETGNPIAYGLMESKAIAKQDYFVSFVPHAFNYDKETNTYYDTTYFRQDEGRKTKSVFIITDAVCELYNGDLTTKCPSPSLDYSYGGLLFLTHKDKTYAFEGREHTQPEESDPAKIYKFRKMRYVEAL